MGKGMGQNRGAMPIQLFKWEWMPKEIKAMSRRSVKAIRTIWLFSSLSPVPKSRIEAALTRLRQIGEAKYYYRPTFDEFDLSYRERSQSPIGPSVATSSEVFFIDDIRSAQEYKERLANFFQLIEKEEGTLIHR